LRRMVVRCDWHGGTLANAEFMFPFVSLLRWPQNEMLKRSGSTLVGSAITYDKTFQRQLMDAPQIDRLNLGPVPTIQLDWLQPHEGNIVEFLFRPRAFQERLEMLAVSGNQFTDVGRGPRSPKPIYLTFALSDLLSENCLN